MKPLLPTLLLALATGLAGAPATAAPSARVTDPQAPRELPGDGPVRVSWSDPAGFSEITRSGNRHEAVRGDWVHELASHLEKTARARLAPGQQLQVRITDIDLAGDYEPWQGPRMSEVRMLRDIYPPRIALHYTLQAADGSVLADADQVLTDPGYLHGIAGSRSNRDLHHDKRLLERWLQQLLPAAEASAGR